MNAPIINYPTEFKDLLGYIGSNGLNNDSNPAYIGFGNPAADILIIGKECAIDTRTPDGMNAYNAEIKENYDDWCNNVANNTQFNDVRNWNNVSDKYKNFNPLWPYKLQINKRFTGQIKFPSDGTGSTWFNYQKLISKYRGTDKSSHIDFFTDCFITEMSTETRKSNGKIDAVAKGKTVQSIAKRKDFFKNTSSFWSRFKIVIFACGNYAEYFTPEDIVNIFGNANVIDSVPQRVPQLSQPSNALIDAIVLKMR